MGPNLNDPQQLRNFFARNPYGTQPLPNSASGRAMAMGVMAPPPPSPGGFGPPSTADKLKAMQSAPPAPKPFRMMTPQQQDQAFGAMVQQQPGYQSFMAQQNAMQNSLRQTQQNLMASGNSQLGVQGRFTPPAGPLPSAPYGTSVMPGVVQRGNVSNMVGVPTQAPELDSLTSARLAAMQQRSADNTARANARYQQSLVENGDTIRQWGMVPGQNFTAGKQYVNGEGYKTISNHALALQRMTPEQRATYDAKKAEADTRAAAARQMRMQRAQYQNAQRGTGVMYNPDGSIDYHNTMMARTAAFNPVEAMRNALASEQQGATLAQQQAAMRETTRMNDYRMSDIAHQRAMEIAGLDATNSPDVRQQLADRQEFVSLPAEQQSQYFHDAVSLADANPNDRTGTASLNNVPDGFIVNEYARLAKHPNWVQDMTAEENVLRERHLNNLRKEAKRRGISLPDVPVEDVPWAAGMGQWLESTGLF